MRKEKPAGDRAAKGGSISIRRLLLLSAMLGWCLASDSTFGFRLIPQQAQVAPAPSFTWMGPEKSILPFRTVEEIETFLKTAEVRDPEKLTIGITGVRRVNLEREGIRMKAVFRSVDVRPNRYDSGAVKVRDYHLFECAAYELSRMLGLDLVPPTVERTVGSERGTLQAWVENATMEKDRTAKGLEPPDPEQWEAQQHVMGVFDNLIFNDDRHLGNILVDESWKVWLIDHTRAFRTYIHMRDRRKIVTCPKVVWERLQSLTEQDFKDRLSPYLTKDEIRTLEKRRRKLIEHIQGLIRTRGIQTVITG